MLDKKINETIDVLIKKIKENNLGSIKLSNKTNTIEEVWWKNEGVTYMGPEKTCRSTSTGDFVLIGNRKYKCAFVGWELV